MEVLTRHLTPPSSLTELLCSHWVLLISFFTPHTHAAKEWQKWVHEWEQTRSHKVDHKWDNQVQRSGLLGEFQMIQLQNDFCVKHWLWNDELHLSSASFVYDQKTFFSSKKLLSRGYLFIMWTQHSILPALLQPFTCRKVFLCTFHVQYLCPPDSTCFVQPSLHHPFPPLLLTERWLGGESADLLKKQLSCNYRLGRKQTVHHSLPPQT